MSKGHKNILWLFVLAFIVAESILILVGTNSYRAKRDHILEDRTVQLRTSYEAIFNTYSLVSNVIYDQIINNPKITELYSRAYKNSDKRQAEIRDSIFQILNPTYIELTSQAIKQLHFHLPDNRSFLRFHRPEKFGDDLSDVRESVRIANAEKRFVQGFEEGKIYNGFRFVYPMSYKEEHIGTVETSISFGAINAMLHKQAHNVYSFIMRKSVVDKKVWESEQDNYVISAVSADWVEEKRFLHYNFSCENLPKEVLEKLDKVIREEHQNRLDEALPFSVFVDLGENKYTISFIPVFNIKKEQVAYVMSYMLDVYSDSYIRSVSTFIGGGTFLILIITILLYVVYTKNITIEGQHSALTKSEERYKHIYNTIDIGIITNTIEGKIIRANPKLFSLLGFNSFKELQAFNINNFYVDPKNRIVLIDELTLEKSNQISGEVKWKKKDGSHLLVKFISKKHKDSKGHSYVESVIQDITELRALEESLKSSEAGLRESIAAKDRFFSILAHDLRGPFNSLKGLTELLALDPESIDEERKKRFIQLINSSVQNLSNLIENLLEWSRTQQGTISFQPKEISLETLVKETVELLSEMAFSKHIIILPTIEEDIKLLADENMTKTIIRNLISNAIKFTHKDGLIKVYTNNVIVKDIKKQIEIIVEDNGVGIDKDDLDKLFLIDSGFSNPGTENEKGTGLGLVIIKEFVEKHSGSISIESELGIGTKVIFTLPVAV